MIVRLRPDLARGWMDGVADEMDVFPLRVAMLADDDLMLVQTQSLDHVLSRFEHLLRCWPLLFVPRQDQVVIGLLHPAVQL